MNQNQLAAIRQRADAATPGPWLTIQPGGPNGPFWGICNQQGNVIALRLSQSPEDAAFIAAARADIPALLNAVDRLRAERTTADVASVRWEQKSDRLERENARLRAALEAVEYAETSYSCPWCHWYIDLGHASDCQRQAALRAEDA